MIKRESFLVIQGWMLNDLKLSGNKLIIYACIYGFTKDNQGEYTGSAQYLANWAGATKRTALNILDELTEEKYIIKKVFIKNGVRFCNYSANLEKLPSDEKISPPDEKISPPDEKISPPSDEKISPPDEKISPPDEKISPPPDEKISPHNIDIYNNNNNIVNNIGKTKKGFVKPTVEEVLDYCKERENKVNAEQFIDYYESKGWLIGKAKMKDWNAAVRTWERNSFQNSYSSGKTVYRPKGTFASSNPNDGKIDDFGQPEF